MKAISLHQPWATLVISGAKTFETRSWITKHRGPLLIHAAKHFPEDIQAMCQMEPFRSALHDAGFKSPLDLPRGVLLGCVHVHDCHPVEDVLSSLEEPERSFGDYRDGRHAWLLSQPTLLTVPLSYRGHQGLFDVPDEILPDAFRVQIQLLSQIPNNS